METILLYISGLSYELDTANYRVFVIELVEIKVVCTLYNK
jgi:hypothetical protein